jgi:hypothetical protein
MAESLVEKAVELCRIYQEGLCTHGEAESVLVNEVIKTLAKKFIQAEYHRMDYPDSLEELKMLNSFK